LLRALRHLIELPFVLPEADAVRGAEDATWHDQRFQRALVSWGRLEPQRDVDQYVVWSNAASGLIERIDCTVRFVAPFLTARVELGPQLRHAGFTLPREMVVHDDALGVVHRWRITSVNAAAR
jgi:hypothetical protein